MTSQLNVALIRKLRVSLVCLAYSLHIINGYLNNQTLADVRSTGAGIKCLFCICTHRNAALGVCAIAMALVGINLHFFWTFGEKIVPIEYTNKSSRYACNQRETFDDFLNQIWLGLETVYIYPIHNHAIL